MSELDPALSARVQGFLEAKNAMRFAKFSMSKLSGGACQENFRVEATGVGEGALSKTWVLRSDAARSLPSSLKRAEEAQIVNYAAKLGVKTPAAQWYTEDLVAAGRGSYWMDWVDGEAIGRRVVKAPALARARETLAQSLAEQLAIIHSVIPSGAPELSGLSIDWQREVLPSMATLRSLRTMISRLPEPHPAIELATLWLEKNLPRDEHLCLVHGDFRTGNFLVTPEGLTGVLDWEFAHWGDPMEDLAWVCVRDWRFGELRKPVGGFATRSQLYSSYEKYSGRSVDHQKVRWWEVMGNVRWATGSVMQGERYLSGDEQDIELLAIARRACEMEWEALRLIRQQKDSSSQT